MMSSAATPRVSNHEAMGCETRLRLRVDASLGLRESHAGTIERHGADFIHGAGIGMAQLARGSNRGVAIGAVDDVKAQQLLLGLGEGTIGHHAFAWAAQHAGAVRRPKARRRSQTP